MVLYPVRSIDLPKHASGGFDHAAVYEENGYVYVAHPANGSVELLNGVKGTHLKTIMGCPEASGVVCAQAEGHVFAASRGSGKVLVINGVKGTVIRVVQSGAKPNGLAWDSDHGVLLAADVQDLNARLIDPERGVLSTRKLPGRPRWCAYSKEAGRFLILIRDPPSVVALDPRNGNIDAPKTLNAAGPHGVDVDSNNGMVYVACDSGVVLALDSKTLSEKARVRIAGEPDVAWFNPRRSFLYVALHKPGAIAVVDAEKMSVAQTVKTEPGAGTLAFDNSRQRLYSLLPASCKAAVYTES